VSDQSYEPTAGGASGPRAGFFQRLGAYIVDVIIVGVVYLIVWAIAGEAAATVVGLLVSIGYYIYFEGSPSGQTLGKKVLGIRVVDYSTGGPLGYSKAFIRWLGRILSGICILGYLWMLWDKEKQTWHDKIAGTVVVPVSAYPVTEP
jgi:uncharacterized RDD family membrane protein YckC